MKKIIKFTLLSLGSLLLLLIFAINIYVNKVGDNMCHEEDFPRQAALVLGARVWDDGRMSDIFRDRVETGLWLYNNKAVEKILISGDHGQHDYNELKPAKEYLLAHGVAPDDIFLDHAGFNTYNSLYRAREIFKAKNLVLVTQDFHLPRALYIANRLGLEACGVSSDIRSYYGKGARDRREVLAKVKAFLNVLLSSTPKYLGEEIPLQGSGLSSWD